MSSSHGTTPVNPVDRWNSRFSEDGYLFGTEPNAWLREYAHHFSPGQRVLSVADGDGRNSVWLASQGLQVDAFDFSEVGVSKARRLAALRGVSVSYCVSDADGYDWPQAALDGVVTIFVQFADPAMRSRMFANMVASLRPGGTLILLGYTLRQLQYKTGGPSEPSHLYSEALLRESFQEMEILHLREYEAELSEGAAHSGKSALIGLVARKR